MKLLDMLIRDPGPLWSCFERYWPADAAKARAGVSREAGELVAGWEILACRRLVSEDRKTVIRAAEKANRFASKRAAHSVPDEPVSTTFSDLDAAIEVLKTLTEKYALLVCAAQREALEPLHRAGIPTDDALLARVERRDLLQEMKSSKLSEGWDSIFLEPWATRDIIALPLGEMPPPKRAASG